MITLPALPMIVNWPLLPLARVVPPVTFKRPLPTMATPATPCWIRPPLTSARWWSVRRET